MTQQERLLDLGPPNGSAKVPEAPRDDSERLRAVLNSMGDALLATDGAGLVTFINPVAELLTGWTQAHAVGVAVEEVCPIASEDDGPPAESPTARALREGGVVGVVGRTLRRADGGSVRSIDGSAAPILGPQGAVSGAVLVFRDVTERRRQEQQTREALAYAEGAVATLRQPFLVLDKNLRVKAANRAFYRNFRAAKPETEGRLLSEVGGGEWDIPALRTLLEDVLPHKRAFQEFEAEHEFPEVGRRILLLNAHRFEGTITSLELIFLAFEDVTERRQAELALLTSESRFRRLFEAAKDGILVLHARTGRITDANPFMTTLLGYPHAELLGKELWEIGLFKDVSENQAAFRELQEKGYIRYAHLPLLTQQCKKVEVEFVSNVYEVDHRKVIQCNVRDISERSRLERQTKEQAEALADLHRRKDEFLAMLSHELRAPLAPIFNAIHLLRIQGNENPIQHQARIIIERQVGQLARLVDDLLEVSRITTGRVRLQREYVDVRCVVQQALETVRPVVERRHHELAVSLPPQPAWSHVDPGRLEQVMVNLLTNACKFMEEGGRVELTVQPERDEVVVRVQDSGVGIAAEMLPRIFELFTQADRSLDRSQGGLGIGLALVQRLVEMHGGTVQVFSEGPGQGSEFVVRLPSSPPPTAREPKREAVREQPEASCRVLVVDDNADTAASMALLLRLSRHDVRTEHSGPAALETAPEYRPDIVMLDIGLPGMDGYEVARRLRRKPEFQGVWLIAATGYGREGDMRSSQEAGFDHHLVKPVNPLKLLELLARLAVQPRPVL